MSDLRTRLASLGLSQAEFARRIGRDAGTVSRWCRGLHPVDSAATAWLDLYEASKVHG